MDSIILERAQAWAQNESIDTDSRAEIQQLIDTEQNDELVSRFYQTLEFGTAGIRGIMGAGLNRFNVYLVRQVSQGFANYLKEQNTENTSLSMAIAYDNRNNSEYFAHEAASVFAANGIQVLIYPELRPTPMLSFAVRELKTTAGVMITASHNPPEYNGYKVFWSDGCQISAPHDDGIMRSINAITDYGTIQRIDYEKGLQNQKIQLISQEVDQAFYDKIEQLSLGTPDHNAKLHVVYTPLHGAGHIPVMHVMKQRGFVHVTEVAEQALPDGNFPTVKSPNPETPSSFECALQTATEHDTLLLATDPDADRLGVMVRKGQEWISLSGNQIGQMALEYYLGTMKQQNCLPKDGFVASTIVTSELTRKIAESYGLNYYENLTGFKNIGNIIRKQEEQGTGTFIFGMEEANGYLFTDFVRDKDGVGATLVFAEMVADLAALGKTPLDFLDEMYQKYGYHEDSQINFVLEGKAGAEKIQEIMKKLRNAPPKSIGSVPVSLLKDYQQHTIWDMKQNTSVGTLETAKSNVLAFFLEDQNRITVRPSGTEPKIKFYFNLCGTSASELANTRKKYESVFTELIQSL